jgi:uncharacterized protein (TIGR03435 family)
VKPTGFGLLLVAATLSAQTTAFEVASIRPATDARRAAREPFFCPFGCFNEGRWKIAGSRVDIAFMSLDQLIVRAYLVKLSQLSGPDWMRNQRFDIQATIPEGASAAQVPEMLQAMLSDRFKLVIHRETRDQPVYALVVDKNGPNLKDASSSAISEAPSDSILNSPQGPVQARQTDNAMLVTKSPWGPMRFTLSVNGQKGPEMELLSVTMPMFADALTQFMDRPVVDKTNLRGSYQIGLSTQDMESFVAAKAMSSGPVRVPPPPGRVPDSPRDPNATTASDPTGGSTIFKSMEKLGLKLERTKLPVEMLVVDHLEKAPTNN